MRTMPDPPREVVIDDIPSVVALQKWVWACVANGWGPPGSTPENTHWTHDDNLMAQAMGWMILSAPGSQRLTLFSLRGSVAPATILEALQKVADADPFAAKALAVLGRSKILYG